MAKWIEYTGSAEQIRELKANTHGYIVRNIPPITGFILSPRIRYAFELSGISEVKFEYLICQPHPYADLIDIWRLSGCPVWYRAIECKDFKGQCLSDEFNLYPFARPDKFEYRLTPFED